MGSRARDLLSLGRPGGVSIEPEASALFDLQFDETGRLHAWYRPPWPEQYIHAWRDPGQDWQRENVVPPGIGAASFGVTQTGGHVSFDYVDAEANEDYVVADEGSGAYPLSSPHTWSSGGLLFHAYAVPPALPRLDGAGPRFVSIRR